MRIRLYFDEDSMDRALLRALRARGVDAMTALEARMIEVADERHLEFASSQGRALSSFNAGDFYGLHTAFLTRGQRHSGLILSRQQEYSVGDRMRRLLRLIESVTAEEMENRVEFLRAWG